MPTLRATGKIQWNNYHHENCGPSSTGKILSVSLIFTHQMHRNDKNRKVRSALRLQRRFRSALVHSELLSVYFFDEHQKPNYFGLMIPKKLKSFEKLDKTTIIKAIKCEKPASKIKNYIDITRSRGRGVF